MFPSTSYEQFQITIVEGLQNIEKDNDVLVSFIMCTCYGIFEYEEQTFPPYPQRTVQRLLSAGL